MGLYAVDFVFECLDDGGDSIPRANWQEMDAFIGYAGPGRTPPSVIVIDKNRAAKDGHTGERYDPAEWGHEDTTSHPRGWNLSVADCSEGEFLEVTIVDGRATAVKRCHWDD